MKTQINKNKLLFIIVILFSIINQVSNLSFVLLIKEILDNFVVGKYNYTFYYILPVTAAALYFSIIIRNYLLAIYIKKINILIKDYFTKNLFKKDISELQSENSHKFVSSYTNDLNAVEINYLIARATFYNMLLNIIFSVAITIYISPIIMIALLISISIQILLSQFFGKKLMNIQKEKSKLFENYTTYSKESLNAFHIIKSNKLLKKFSLDFYEHSRKLQEKNYQLNISETYIFITQNFITMLILSISVGLSGYLGVKGLISIGGFLILINSTSVMFGPLSSMIESFNKMKSGKAVIERLDQILENKENKKDRNVPVDSFKEDIIFNNVSFSYKNKEESKSIFKDLNLSFIKGKKYLLTGPSGGGKSTLLKLIRNYYHVDEGEILIDNIDINTLKLDSYFKTLSYIEQNVFIFDESIKNNITLFKDYSDSEIEQAIKYSGLENLVNSNKEGINFKIIDGGKNISGGEKSRIAIARALIQKSDIMIIDEAFSSLDDKTAKSIEKTILDLNYITVINVSHVIFNENKKLYNKHLIVKDNTVISSQE